MAQGEDARGDLLWAGRILAQAEGMKLLMDEERLGQGRGVAVYKRELAPANVHHPAARAGLQAGFNHRLTKPVDALARLLADWTLST